MEGILNLLKWINDNWAFVIIIIALGLGLYRKIDNYLSLSSEEQINEALKAVKGIILSKMAAAEIQWEDYKKSGALKRSEVIAEIYNEFPILKEAVDQEKLIEAITKMIDDEMNNMNKIINNIGVEQAAEEIKG
jgi:coenzyme F420-reducing hydrogenase delta subunit